VVHVPAALQALVLVLAALLATAVVLTRNPLRQIVVNGAYGLVLVLVFFVLQAPDVALSMLVVTTIAYPLIVLAAIARTRHGDLVDEEQDK
jgi:energy-converting hydrogenase B subunit D